MTNGDAIRIMNDEELLAFLCDWANGIISGFSRNGFVGCPNVDTIQTWIREEVKYYEDEDS